MTFHQYMTETFGKFDGVMLFHMAYLTVLLFFASRIFVKDKKAWKILKVSFPLSIICMVVLMGGIVLTKYIGV